MTQFSDRERFNWGYWDGRADQVSRRIPQWKSSHNDNAHPFDVSYGKGYYAGLYDHSEASNSDVAWNTRVKGSSRKARVNRTTFG